MRYKYAMSTINPPFRPSLAPVHDRTLGVLGGMGPLASAHFMIRLTLLTPAETDQAHIPTILWSDPRVPDRMRARQGGESPLPALLRGIAGLRQAGAGAIAIPCNTAHGWYDEMQAAAGVKLFHIVDAALAHLPPLHGRPVGVMGTAATLAMRLYQDRLEALGHAAIIPSDDEMARLVTPAIALVKANRVTEAYAPLAAVAESLARRGAGAVVLGCTEIPLGIKAGPAERIGVTLIDTIDTLALTAIAWAHDSGRG
jgi:aspartate racemase